MAGPDYSMIDSMGAESPSDDEATETTKLSATEKMLADKFGFSEEQAEGLKEFIQECMSSGYDTTGAPGDMGAGEG